MFDVLRQIAVAIATYAQTTAKNMAPTRREAPKTLFGYLSNCKDLNTHIQLFL